MRVLISFLLFVTFFPFFANAQTLHFEENFDYGVSSGALTALTGNWTTHSGTNEQIQYEPGEGLSYSGYPSSTGGGVYVNGSNSEDVNRTFSAQTSGSVYLSFLISVTAASSAAAGDYNVHFNNGTFVGRFYIRNDGGVLFGISKSSESPEWTSTTYALNTTYCVVIKYTFVDGSNNDLVDLFVFDGAIPSTEPSPTIEHVDATASDAPGGGIDAISLRQGGTANRFYIDGIRVSDSWAQAPLPVELTSFSAELVNNTVELNWETATETNNAGFEMQRQNPEPVLSEDEGWEVLTFIPGHGTTNSPKYYSYVDSDLPNADKVSYRLRQIDNDGTDAYSKTVEVELGGVTSVEDEVQFTFALEQNYPNPFNPVTTINFTLPSVGTTHELSQQAKLTVYNLLGQEVRTLVNEAKPAGSYQIQFDASDLPSGIYFYSLTYGNHIQTRKLALLK